MSLSRFKCSTIVKDVLTKRETEKLIENLKTCKFFILLDESTDITDTKFMCLLVRYVCPNNEKIKTQLLELLALNARDLEKNCCEKNFFNL